MCRPRVWLVSAVTAIVVGGSCFDIVTAREHWPFSPYRMYAMVLRQPSLTALRLFGVTDRVPPGEIALSETRYTEPLNAIRLHHAFTRMNVLDEGQPHGQRLAAALNACLERYEALRQAGRHEGPPLQGMRLYRLTWKLEPWARNADRPDEKALLLEVKRQTLEVRH
jgi:hypothetical protein